jgi:activator of Hsp90 ATPase-like protein
MKNQNYSKTITAKITASEAANRISRVSDWWAKNVKGASQKLGDTFTVDFGEKFADFKIVELIPGKKIVWLVTNCNQHWIPDITEWNNTQVMWEISTDNKTTTVRMTHVGLVPANQCYENCEQGWNFYVGQSLLKLLTENKGLPDGMKSLA